MKHIKEVASLSDFLTKIYISWTNHTHVIQL